MNLKAVEDAAKQAAGEMGTFKDAMALRAERRAAESQGTVTVNGIAQIILDTGAGPIAFKVKGKHCEELIARMIMGFVDTGDAKLFRLPSNMVVTGSITMPEGES